jgi:molybdate transport system ATP-binding protein
VSLDAELGVHLDRLELSVQLTAAGGETVVVLGPNGAGKTTALRAVAGLRPLDQGRVAVDGQVLDEPSSRSWVPTERRPIGFVFQDYLLFPHLSALDNVAFGLRARGVPRRAARARAGGWLERVGLGGAGDAKPATLSGGEAQRVALARALAVEPSVLLLDEPLGALDATTRIELRRELRRCLASSPAARLLVTHDPVDAVALADRVVVLEAGRVVQDGTVEDLQARPRTRYVADLVGVNLYRADVDGSRARVEPGGELAVINDRGLRGPVLVVVRPQAVALHQRRPEGSPRNVWPATVREVDVVGDRARVQLEGRPAITAEVTRGAAAELALTSGAPVWVSVKAADLSLFPA